MTYLNKLNSEQKKAVLTQKGPLLIIAGAGAGKTRTIAYRIVHLIKSGVHPNNILAVTFTNKAAQEMRDRVGILIKELSLEKLPYNIFEQPFIGTFHALGVHILRNSGRKIGIQKNFSILDKSGSFTLIKEAMRSAGIDPKQFEPKRIQNIISRNKGELIDAHQYADQAGNDFFPKIVASVWLQYEKLINKAHSLDFDDLLLKTVMLFSREVKELEFYQKKWRYIHIDEYQDTNKAQYIISRKLAESHCNICVVGDSDQNIYSWRGANIKNILGFEKDYPKTKIIFLEENYRSSATILEAANSVIEKNTMRVPKNLFTHNGKGDRISLFAAPNELFEALFVANKTKELIKNGVLPEKIAVLYRANFQSRVLEESFLSEEIPYQVIGVRFFERKEIKDILSYIRASLNPESLHDIKRVISVPPRGIGKATVIKIFAGKRNTLHGKIAHKVKDFFSLLSQIKKASEEMPPSQLIKLVLEKSGLKKHLSEDGEDGQERLENIKELVTLASRYDKLPNEDRLEKFLEDAALASDQDALIKESGGVKLMTVHASKGLEYPYLFIVGLEQGLFPHEYLGESGETLMETEKAEEERRLFYVALTRAGKKLYLSYAEKRTIFGSVEFNLPSEFLEDIDPSLIEHETLEEGELLPSISID